MPTRQQNQQGTTPLLATLPLVLTGLGALGLMGGAQRDYATLAVRP